jgi:hypothetical protein
MAAPALARIQRRKRGPSRALQIVRQRLDDPDWQPTVDPDIFIEPPELPYEGFVPSVLADNQCSMCSGTGMRIAGVRPKHDICPCVYRRIARQCAMEYLRVEEMPMPRPRGRHGGTWYDMPRHEWAADFWRMVNSTLGREFRPIWILSRIYRLPSETVQKYCHTGRGTMFHRLYKADSMVGKSALWCQPHALYPPREYCSG